MKWKNIIKKKEYYKDFLVPMIFGGWLLYQFIGSFALAKSNYDSLGSDGYARIVSGVGLLLIVIYLVQKGKEAAKISQNEAQAEAENGEAGQGNPASFTKESILTFARTHYELSMLVLCVIYVFLINRIGFIVSSALYLFISMMLYSSKESRNTKVIILLTVLFSAGTYFLFRYGFTIVLP